MKEVKTNYAGHWKKKEQYPNNAGQLVNNVSRSPIINRK
jgi:hypothetical protein